MSLALLRPTVFDGSNVVAAFTTRAGGVSHAPFASFNLGFSTGDDPDAVRENRSRLLDTLGFDRLATVGQVHGADVAIVSEPGHTDQHDGLATDAPGLGLGILVADCGAVLLADTEAGVVGACHAGWRGTVAEIPATTVEAMRELGADAKRIRVYISPCIGPNDFEVGPEVATQFDDTFVRVPTPGAKPHVDLAGAIAHQLREAGIAQKHIEVDGRSTFDTDHFFSYRAEGGTTGRMMGLIGLRHPS